MIEFLRSSICSKLPPYFRCGYSVFKHGSTWFSESVPSPLGRGEGAGLAHGGEPQVPPAHLPQVIHAHALTHARTLPASLLSLCLSVSLSVSVPLNLCPSLTPCLCLCSHLPPSSQVDPVACARRPNDGRSWQLLQETKVPRIHTQKIFLRLLPPFASSSTHSHSPPTRFQTPPDLRRGIIFSLFFLIT